MWQDKCRTHTLKLEMGQNQNHFRSKAKIQDTSFNYLSFYITGLYKHVAVYANHKHKHYTDGWISHRSNLLFMVQRWWTESLTAWEMELLCGPMVLLLSEAGWVSSLSISLPRPPHTAKTQTNNQLSLSDHSVPSRLTETYGLQPATQQRDAVSLPHIRWN